ncbi:MAG: hypothetical protein WC829_06985 [Hyphomicrobium sp.]|jgi:hypothetical protein
MNRFHIIEEAAAILRTKGVWKQVKVYLRGEAVYVSVGGGYVRLYKGGGTSVPNVSWEDIDLNGAGPDSLTPDAHGKLSFNGSLKQIEATAE